MKRILRNITLVHLHYRKMEFIESIEEPAKTRKTMRRKRNCFGQTDAEQWKKLIEPLSTSDMAKMLLTSASERKTRKGDMQIRTGDIAKKN